MRNPFDLGYYTENDLASLGFRSLGQRVLIAKQNNIVGLENIEIGDDVRIDAYCTIVAGEAGIRVGSNVHIAGYCMLSGGSGIQLMDFSGLSQGVCIYSRTDDYSGDSMTNPTVPDRYKRVASGAVTLGRHVIVGSGSVILPRVEIGEGCSVGALSLITKSLAPWGVYFGSPAKRLKDRSRKVLELESDYLAGKRG